MNIEVEGAGNLKILAPPLYWPAVASASPSHCSSSAFRATSLTAPLFRCAGSCASASSHGRPPLQPGDLEHRNTQVGGVASPRVGDGVPMATTSGRAAPPSPPIHLGLNAVVTNTSPGEVKLQEWNEAASPRIWALTTGGPILKKRPGGWDWSKCHRSGDDEPFSICIDVAGRWGGGHRCYEMSHYIFAL